jgi:hypothetical protein
MKTAEEWLIWANSTYVPSIFSDYFGMTKARILANKCAEFEQQKEELLAWLEWVNDYVRPLIDNCNKKCDGCLGNPCNFLQIEKVIAKAKGDGND